MRALIVTGQGAQDAEFIYPFYRLQEADYEVTVLTANDGPCTGIAGTKIQPSGPRFKEMRFLRSAFLDAKVYRPDVLVIPGGVKAMEHMRLNEDLVRYVSDYYASGGVVAAICSGVQLLISAGIVRGRHASIYPAFRVDLENAGGTFVDMPAVVDERIVTTSHYRHLGPWMAATLSTVQYPNGFQ